MADWDAEDFEPELPAAKAAVKTDKWDGEDEDDDVKDAWDAESGEEGAEGKEEGESTTQPIQRKKKKNLKEILAQKEAAREKELEELALQREEMEALNTPEAKMAEKIRLQKLEESTQLELAREMLGVTSVSDSTGLNFKAESEEEFTQLSSALLDKFRDIESSENFQIFGEQLIAGISMNLSVATLKKVKGSVEGMISAKLKEEKAIKAKKGGKGAGKATIRMETDRSMFGRGLDDGYNDMDDFM